MVRHQKSRPQRLLIWFSVSLYPGPFANPSSLIVRASCSPPKNFSSAASKSDSSGAAAANSVIEDRDLRSSGYLTPSLLGLDEVGYVVIDEAIKIYAGRRYSGIEAWERNKCGIEFGLRI